MPFTATYTAFCDAQPDAVWAILSDISNWPSWDVRLENTQLHGNVKSGSSYTLKPTHGNEIKIEVVQVGNHTLKDRAKLGIGTVATERTITPIDGGCLITQTLTATTDARHTRTFGKVFWPEWSQGIIESTKALASAAVKGSPSRTFPVSDEIEQLLAAHRNV